MHWWVVTAVVGTLTKYVNKIFIQLQSDNLLVSQQRFILEKLATDICLHTYVDGPYSADTIAELAQCPTNLTFGRFSISFASIIEVVYDQGLFIRETYDNLEITKQIELISVIGRLILSVIEGIIAIQVERDSENCPGDEMPPVLPHELVKLRTGQFGVNVLAQHLPQLRLMWTEDNITQIERDHRELREEYHQNLLLQAAINKCDHNTTFKTGWEILSGKYTALRDFLWWHCNSLCQYGLSGVRLFDIGMGKG